MYWDCCSIVIYMFCCIVTCRTEIYKLFIKTIVNLAYLLFTHFLVIFLVYYTIMAFLMESVWGYIKIKTCKLYWFSKDKKNPLYWSDLKGNNFFIDPRLFLLSNFFCFSSNFMFEAQQQEIWLCCSDFITLFMIYAASVNMGF